MWKPIVKLLIAAAAYYVAWHIAKNIDADYAPISILLVSWVCVIIFAPDIVKLFTWFKLMGERSALQSLHGSCYVFDGDRFGFYLHKGIIWVPIKEIQTIIQPSISERELRLLGQEYGKIPEQKSLA